jgi:uncharacterized protein
MIQLNKKHYAIIKTILRKNFPDAKIWLFGSRVEGLAKKYSDLDILIKLSNNTLKVAEDAAAYGSRVDFFNSRADFAESDIPFKIDLVDWDKMEKEFRHEVLKNAIELEQAENFCVDDDA